MSLVIADTACLVGLDRIGHLTLLAETFSDVVIPAAVAQEFGRVPDGTACRDPEDEALVRQLVRQLVSSLGAGEAEVIALAVEHPGSLLVLDDRPARREARTRGLLVTGTLGVLIRVKRRGHVERIRPLMDALLQVGFRLSNALYDDALRQAGEH